MKNALVGAGVAGALMVGGYMLLNSNENSQSVASLKVPVPYAQNVAGNTSFACKSLMSANVVGDSIEDVVNGEVAEGTDKVAMTIKDEKTLTFMTGASIEIGVTEGDDFAIVQNTNQQLMAVWFNENVVSSVVLNKKNGLAVWTKGNPDFITLGVPVGLVVYLSCI